CAVRLLEQPVDSKVAVVFGPEKSGLKNEDLDRCNALLTIPTDPSFSSLNIAMAVQVICYELRLAAADSPAPAEPEAPPATSEELEHFYVHLEDVLTRTGFLNPEHPRHLMRRLRRLFTKAEPDKNEINILRGILTAVEPAAQKRP
ncbi:MAG: RNA methyltransferase, partial [Woeseiaceae bacterium]